jgi:hypothetical protein
MTEHKQPNPDLTRIIVLVYGMMEAGGPFWVFVAVKPSKYQAFMTAQKEGTLDLYKFAPFGEIIVSGEGRQPPDEVTLKVAEMYQTDPTEIFQAIDKENESDDAAAAAEGQKPKK